MRIFGMFKARLVGLALAAAAFAAMPATAQEPDVNELIRSLGPMQESAGAPEAAGSVEEVMIGGRRVLVSRLYRVDLTVYFPFDSAELTPRARLQLRALGRALESPQLSRFRYVIAGHTDATGSAAYNQQLSDRRAASVVRFLVGNFAIDPARLIWVGWGESRLKTPNMPNAAINRRVEVLMIITRESAVAPATPETVAPAADAAPDTAAPTDTLQPDAGGNIKIDW